MDTEYRRYGAKNGILPAANFNGPMDTEYSRYGAKNGILPAGNLNGPMDTEYRRYHKNAQRTIDLIIYYDIDTQSTCVWILF